MLVLYRVDAQGEVDRWELLELEQIARFFAGKYCAEVQREFGDLRVSASLHLEIGLIGLRTLFAFL
jgi:hypothetical protein